MKAPSKALVVDSSVLIPIARGRGASAIASVVERRKLLVTDVAAREAARRIELGMRAPEFLPPLRDAIALMNFIAMEGAILTAAEASLRDAVASRNGSVADAHILACAWAFDADIWSFDRDFAGTGVASWSTANLMRALAVEGEGD